VRNPGCTPNFGSVATCLIGVAQFGSSAGAIMRSAPTPRRFGSISLDCHALNANQGRDEFMRVPHGISFYEQNEHKTISGD
jgi:hypothetical protein